MTETPMRGVIEDMPMLDLTSMRSEEDLAGIARIKDVAFVLVPESLMAAVTRIPMEDVAGVVPVVDGADVRVRTGLVKMDGDALAEPGADNAVLVVTGGLIVTSPVTRVGYRQIVVTGLVLGPRGSEAALGAGLTRVTGAVDYYPYAEGQQVKTQSGQTRMSGDALANPGGSAEDVLVVAGQLMVTSPVAKLGYQRVFAAGQLLVPRESEPVLAPALTVNGQVAWYGGQTTPRFFVGHERFGRGFFELLDEPLTLALVGDFEIEADVPPALVREKIDEITLIGEITASKEVVPVLQLLTTEKYGDISVREDASAE